MIKTNKIKYFIIAIIIVMSQINACAYEQDINNKEIIQSMKVDNDNSTYEDEIRNYINNMSNKEIYINSESFIKIYKYFNNSETIDFIDYYYNNIDENIKKIIFEIIENKSSEPIKVISIENKYESVQRTDMYGVYENQEPYQVIKYIDKDGIKEMRFNFNTIEKFKYEEVISNINNNSESIENIKEKFEFIDMISNCKIKEDNSGNKSISFEKEIEKNIK